jgi:nucleoside diphosphate kinase
MTSGESCILALSKEGNHEDVVNDWRKDMGGSSEIPESEVESFRSQYATDKIINALHGSDSQESAMR